MKLFKIRKKFIFLKHSALFIFCKIQNFQNSINRRELNHTKLKVLKKVIISASTRELRYFASFYMCLVKPKFWPAWDAPLLKPAENEDVNYHAFLDWLGQARLPCRPSVFSPALNCSSVNSRRFSSAGLGPNAGPLKFFRWAFLG